MRQISILSIEPFMRKSLSYLGLVSMLLTTMPVEAWTDPTLPGTPIKATHLQELRDAIDNSIGGHWTGVTGGIKYTGGKVGIGTTAPADLLDVRGIFRLSDGGAGEAANMRLIDTNNDNFLIHLNSDRLYFMRDDNNNISWDDGEEDRITMYGVTDGLRLGVGTSSPTHKLDVRGNGIFSGSLSVPTPINAENAATKGYVDTALSGGTAGNADELDGLNSTQFLRSDADDTATGNITFTNPIKVTNTFNVNGSGPSSQKNGLYVADLGSVQGTTLNPLYTAAIAGQTAAHRSIALTVDGTGYLYGYRGHSDPGTFTFQSKTRYADNANTLDNINSTSFARKDAGNSFSSSYITTFNNVAGRKYNVTSANQSPLQIYQATNGSDAAMTFHVSGDYATYFGLDGTTNDLFVGGWSKGANKYKIWHAGNDGAGSLLVADKLDDIDSSQFVRSDADDTISGQMKFTNANGIQWEGGVNRITHNDGGGNVQIRFGNDFSDGDERFTHTQTAFYIGGGLDSASGSLDMKVATNGGAGNDQPVNWGPTFSVTKTGATLNGNVGIGTTAPHTKMHVTGPVLVEGGSYTARTGTGTDSKTDAALVIDRGDAIYFENNGYLRNLLNVTSAGHINVGQTGTSLVSSVNLLTGVDGFAAITSGGSETMRVTGGNVGIGTTNPTAKLHVEGNISTIAPISDEHVATKAYVDSVCDSTPTLVGGSPYYCTEDILGTVNNINDFKTCDDTTGNFCYQGNCTAGGDSICTAWPIGMKCEPTQYCSFNATCTKNYRLHILDAGGAHACAILNDGSAKCWGGNTYGALGDGSTTNRSTPVNVLDINSAIQVTAGSGHTCVLLGDNSAKCWGYNGQGQLGNGTYGNSPGPVNTVISNAVQISAGLNHTCAVMDDGRVKCWGYNNNGQLGNGNNTNQPLPVYVSGLNDVKQVSAGGYHTCAVLNSGAMKCWGFNHYGQLGNGTEVDQNLPVDVVGIDNALQVDLSHYKTCALLDDGSIQCWGKDQSSTIPVTVPDVSNAIQVAVGQYRFCVLLDNGSVQCSAGGFTNLDPTSLNDVRQISAGIGTDFFCGLLDNGLNKCWGTNGHGQLGDGTTTNSTTPVNVLNYDYDG